MNKYVLSKRLKQSGLIVESEREFQTMRQGIEKADSHKC